MDTAICCPTGLDSGAIQWEPGQPHEGGLRVPSAIISSCQLSVTLLQFLSLLGRLLKSFMCSNIVSSMLWEITERVYIHAWDRRVGKGRRIVGARRMVSVENLRILKRRVNFRNNNSWGRETWVCHLLYEYSTLHYWLSYCTEGSWGLLTHSLRYCYRLEFFSPVS